MEGLEKFKEAFAPYSDNYVIIGGTACEIVMRDSIVKPRATHDIDIIVIVENMTADFGNRFWQFVREGGYHPEIHRQFTTEMPKYELFRFVSNKPEYPQMIEVLSRHPDILGEPHGFVIEPLPLDEDSPSLSAIIMDDDFYDFTIMHSTLTEGIRHADCAALVALKTRAYLNLLQDKANGKHVNDRDIKKHRSDVLKNVVVMEDRPITAPSAIVNCVKDFVASIQKEWDILFEPLSKSLGQDASFVKGLLQRLNELFVTE